jgi:hypothetical protein
MTDLRVYRDNSEVLMWKWEAHYVDGSVLHQKDDDGFHYIKEIDQKNLASFWMVSETTQPPIILQWKEGRKLIHFYRVRTMDFGTPQELVFRLYCFGYEGPNEKVIMTIMPDGSVIVSDEVNIEVI